MESGIAFAALDPETEDRFLSLRRQLGVSSFGINQIRLAARWQHFKARPGRYVAVLRATDEANNTAKPLTRAFTIEGTPSSAPTRQAARKR